MMTATEIEIRPASVADDEARDQFVRASAAGTFFHRAGWGRVVERVFAHQRADLLAWQGEELCGVLPMMRCRGLFGGSKLISVPYGVYGGPLGVDAQIEQRLLAASCEQARAERVGRLELRTLKAPEGCDLPASDLYHTFICELPAKPEDVLGTIPKKARAEARKARERHGLELVEGSWYLDDLVRMFHQNKRMLGSPGLPVEWFRCLAKEFGDELVVHLVRRGSEPLAAVMSFCDGESLRAYYSGTAEGADRSYSASNFMYFALREWAVERGFRYFDFGRSRQDAGAFGFKKRQGFEPQPLDYRFCLVGDDELPSFNPSNPKTKILRDTWQKLPAWLALRLSERLARYLP